MQLVLVGVVEQNAAVAEGNTFDDNYYYRVLGDDCAHCWQFSRELKLSFERRKMEIGYCYY